MAESLGEDDARAAARALLPGEVSPLPQERAAPRARVVVPGERLIARSLRGGAFLSGGLFLLSLAVELLPVTQATSIAVDHLRKAAASVLLVTPVVRLAVAGVSLGLRGEWRYLAYAMGVLALLALAVGAGFSA